MAEVLHFAIEHNLQAEPGQHTEKLRGQLSDLLRTVSVNAFDTDYRYDAVEAEYPSDGSIRTSAFHVIGNALHRLEQSGGVDHWMFVEHAEKKQLPFDLIIFTNDGRIVPMRRSLIADSLAVKQELVRDYGNTGVAMITPDNGRTWKPWTMLEEEIMRYAANPEYGFRVFPADETGLE